MNLFYATVINGNVCVLDENESKHAVQVLRLKNGASIRLMDGKGTFYDAIVTVAHPKKCEAEITGKTTLPARKLHLHVAVAPTKMNERTEWFLEKAVEIGVEEITPVICDRSERRTTNQDRFEKVIVTAMKQSMQAYKPILNQQQQLSDFLKSARPGFIAHCLPGEKKPLKKCIGSTAEIVLLIGPEGDFTASEVNTAVAAGWVPVDLGPSRLRTETAALVALHTANLFSDL